MKNGKRGANTSQHESRNGEAGAVDNQTAGCKKSDLLEIFFKKYGYRLPIETTPSDNTFSLVARARKNKSCEFSPLTRVTSAADARDIGMDHVRIKGNNGDFLFDPTRSLTRRNADFSSSAEAFLHAIRILMNSYAMASGNDPGGLMWSSLQAATRRITAAESCARACARSRQGVHPKLLECEMAVRKEWRRVATSEPGLLLSDIIELVIQRRSIWPTTFELKTAPPPGRDQYQYSRNGKGPGKGKGGKGRDQRLTDRRWEMKQADPNDFHRGKFGTNKSVTMVRFSRDFVNSSTLFIINFRKWSKEWACRNILVWASRALHLDC